jgi:hypothetical protein
MCMIIALSGKYLSVLSTVLVLYLYSYLVLVYAFIYNCLDWYTNLHRIAFGER